MQCCFGQMEHTGHSTPHQTGTSLVGLEARLNQYVHSEMLPAGEGGHGTCPVHCPVWRTCCFTRAAESAQDKITHCHPVVAWVCLHAWAAPDRSRVRIGHKAWVVLLLLLCWGFERQGGRGHTGRTVLLKRLDDQSFVAHPDEHTCTWQHPGGQCPMQPRQAFRHLEIAISPGSANFEFALLPPTL